MDDYQKIFRQAQVGLGVADLRGKLLECNEALLEPGGYSRDDLQAIGDVASLYADGPDLERVLERLRAAGKVSREEFQLLRRDGSAYDTLLSLVPVRFKGEPCVLATVEDITDLKREIARRRALEAELWQAQKMVAVGEMTAGISHDVKNVLAVIRACADLLEDAIDPEDAEARQDLDELKAATERGVDMVQKLLGFSRKADITLVPFDVCTILDAMERRVRALLPDDIEYTVQSGGVCTAACDPTALEQMVMNLVLNARDAMPAGGAIHVRVADVRIESAEELPDWMEAGAYVRVSVTDQGIGMDEETRERALEPFFTTKPGTSGTGLGLSMVYGLVKQHGGFIDLQSAPGEGTTASLYFPQNAEDTP